MASNWSSADIENDLKKLLKIGQPSSSTDQARSSSEPVVVQVAEGSRIKKVRQRKRSSPKDAKQRVDDAKQRVDVVKTEAATSQGSLEKNDKRILSSAAASSSKEVAKPPGAVAAGCKPSINNRCEHASTLSQCSTPVVASLPPSSIKPKSVKQRHRNLNKERPASSNAFSNAIESVSKSKPLVVDSARTTTKALQSAVKPAHEIKPMSVVRNDKAGLKLIQNCKTDRGQSEDVKFKLPPLLVSSTDAACKDLMARDLLKIDGHPEIPPPADVLAILAAHHIFPMKKKSQRHPNARYACRLCVYHCDAVTVCVRHLKSDKHQALKKELDTDVLLQHIPTPSGEQTKALEALLVSTVSNNLLDCHQLLKRKCIVEQLNELLKGCLPDGCELMMFGSSASGVGHKTSDLNISLDMKSDSEANPAVVLRNVLQTLLSKKSFYTKVEMDLDGKVPSVYFLHAEDSVQCVIGLGSGNSVKTTRLIQSYAAFDERARLLCNAFRHWAKVCLLNAQERGTLPPHTFDLMVIFFLQHCEPPVLPVFHELAPKDENFNLQTIEATWKTENNRNVGYLWVEMLRFYALVFPKNDWVVCIRQFAPLTKSKKNWRARILAVEDPYHPKRNLTRCVRSPKVYDLILMSLKLSFKYFGIPQLNDVPLFDSITPLELSVTRNDSQDHEAISETELSKHPSSSSNDNEESFSAESNDESGGENYDSEDFLSSPKKRSPSRRQTSQSSVGVQEVVHNGRQDAVATKLVEESTTTTDSSEVGLKTKISGTPQDNKNVTKSNEKSSDPRVMKIKCDERRLPLPAELLQKFYAVENNEMKYAFIWKKLTGGRMPILECNICKVEGHLEDNCPEVLLPSVWPLPRMHPAFMDVINRACILIARNACPDKRELNERTAILRDLQSFIRCTYDDAQLRLFGSSCNGFGFRCSDLDICLTFDGDQTGNDLQHADIIVTLASKLKKHKALYQVVAIPTAKVPIVKFIHRQNHLECDLSLYNTLAQHNTSLLRLYSEIDPRVKALGYTMKYFAKVCDIGDASRGSLSSYAYILMVIYFLQQRKPPVIPVLQQLYNRNEQPPQEIIDGCNVWFYKDIDNLHKVWQFAGANVESVGELWLGLLRFYTEEFNFNEFVISIRQLEPLTLFEKIWSKKSIAIEDPFNLAHNLGSGVSRKMNAYILKAFIVGRRIFGTPLMAPPPRYRFIEDYLFDQKQLTDGPPPNDRCCRACGHIGHVARDCPRRKGTKEKVVDDDSFAVERSAKPKQDQTNTAQGVGRQQSASEGVPVIKQISKDIKNGVIDSNILSNSLLSKPSEPKRSVEQSVSQKSAQDSPDIQFSPLPSHQQQLQKSQHQQQPQHQPQQQRPIKRPPPGFSLIPPGMVERRSLQSPTNAHMTAASAYMLQGQCLHFKSNKYPAAPQPPPPTSGYATKPLSVQATAPPTTTAPMAPEMQGHQGGQMRYRYPFPAPPGGTIKNHQQGPEANQVMSLPVHGMTGLVNGVGVHQNHHHARFIPPFIPQTDHLLHHPGSMTTSQGLLTPAGLDDCWKFGADKDGFLARPLPSNFADLDRMRTTLMYNPLQTKLDLSRSELPSVTLTGHQAYQVD